MGLRIALALLAVAALLIGAGAAAFVLAGRYDLGSLAAARASAAFGRKVTIDSLRVAPGRWLTVELHGLRVANIPGGTRPEMVELETATAEVDALSLLHGPTVVRSLVADGLTVMLERANDVANWKFGPPAAPQPAGGPPASRSWVPTITEARLRGEIIFRTTGGAMLHIRLDPMLLHDDGADSKLRLTATGSYNAAALTLDADLAPIAVLRDATAPYPADIRLKSGETTMRFVGTMTEPFDVDGARGAVTLDAPNLDALAAIAGVSTSLDIALRLKGPFEHTGTVWRLADAKGRLNEGAISAATLQFTDSARGTPDRVSANVAFDRLDLNDVLGAPRRKGSSGQADTSLAVDRTADTLVDAKLSAASVAYANVRATNVVLTAGMTSGAASIDELSLTYLGAKLRASARVEAAPVTRDQDGGRVTADIEATGLDVQGLRQELGLAAVPLFGRMNARVAVAALGATLNQAVRSARISAVAVMTGGTVSREIVELASLDLRGLFRNPKGQTGITCALAALDMRGGIGSVLPLRIRTDAGTISGNSDFDLYRKRFDLTIGSEAATTSILALDIPVHVFGPFSDPAIRPAKWSAAARAKLAQGDDITRLLPALRPFARQSPCASGARSR